VLAVDEHERPATLGEARRADIGPVQGVRLLLGPRRGGNPGPQSKRKEPGQRMHYVFSVERDDFRRR
jgi:hypothetical protein